MGAPKPQKLHEPLPLVKAKVIPDERLKKDPRFKEVFQ
jgi:hypothetical protein